MAAIDELKALLSEDIHQLSMLGSLLENERGLLSSSDMKGLAELTAEKQGYLDAARVRARRKIQLLVEMGYRPDQGQPSLFIRASGIEELTRLWDQTEREMSHCQTRNAVNGRIVGNLQKRLTRLADIFRGAAGSQKLYGAKGQQEGVSQRTVLASA